MSEKTLRFNNIRVNKKELHKSKQAIALDSVSDKLNIVKKVISILLVIKKYFATNEWIF